MKIAYIISTGMCVSPFNGIRMQAETWANELAKQGHLVNKVNPWEQQKWEEYDVIHIFGYNSILQNLDRFPSKRIVFSPIIDSFQPIWKYRLASHWGNKKLRITSHNYDMRKASSNIALWFVRSQFEYNYVRKAYGVPDERIAIIPLSYRIVPPNKYPQKESFCLHVSKITDTRKNVERLVDSAIKYRFRLILAGSCSETFNESSLCEKIKRNTNIDYIGRVSDEKLLQLYQSAKVFALPSIGEGVGLVALEAASCGCDIVVTSIGGPKEYYAGKAFVVNPFDIDEIGTSICSALSDNTRQPFLMEYVKEMYNLIKCVHDLSTWYAKISS